MLPKIVQIIGIFIIIMSVIHIIKPAVPRAIMNFCIKGNRMYLGALVRLTIAVIFLLAASQCEYPKTIATFGILFLLSAVLVFFIGIEKTNLYIQWWQKRSDTTLRIAFLASLAIGSAIVYFA